MLPSALASCPPGRADGSSAPRHDVQLAPFGLQRVDADRHASDEREGGYCEETAGTASGLNVGQPLNAL